MGLFSGMEKFGLGKYENTKVFEDKKTEKVSEKLSKTEKQPERTEADILYDKHFTCPVCDLNFTSKCVRAGKLKASGKDTDLRPIYDFADPLKYDVITCDKCGYSSVTRYFGKLSTRQMRDIKDEISCSFKGIDNSISTFSYDDSILRHKLAVLCSVVKKAKHSEKAYTCLKLAWVIRGKRLSLPENDPQIKDLEKDEMECLTNAYEGFIEAISNEAFPIAGMDENTLKYILADIARKLGRYEEAVRLIAGVITSRGASSRIKDEALKLKDLIKEDMKKSQE
ncbi:MAG: DUF2225 domain-containing protein [Wujia sp.]